MRVVIEATLEKPLEVSWDGPPMPVITLRNPEKVSYNPSTECVHVDTGRGEAILPLGSVVRLALGGPVQVTSGQPTQFKASASPLPPERSEASGTTAATPSKVTEGKKPDFSALRDKLSTRK